MRNTERARAREEDMIARERGRERPQELARACERERASERERARESARESERESERVSERERAREKERPRGPAGDMLEAEVAWALSVLGECKQRRRVCALSSFCACTQ